MSRDIVFDSEDTANLLTVLWTMDKIDQTSTQVLRGILNACAFKIEDLLIEREYLMAQIKKDYQS